MSMIRIPPPFGELLRRYRLASGLTQEALAERAGLSVKAITALERGVNRAPRKESLQLLLAALPLSPVERERLVAATLPNSRRSATEPRLPAVRPSAPPFIGRAEELSVLETFLDESRHSALFLAGEPGIGKTRLLQEVAEYAERSGWSVLQGSCQRRGGQEPFAPLVEALERHIALQSPAECRALLEGCAWLTRLLPELVEIILAPAPGWTLPPEQERRLMFQAVIRFLTNATGYAGSLLVLDDLQWAGPDALDLLTAVARARIAQPVRILGAYRDTEVWSQDTLFAVVTDLAREGLAKHMTLGALAPAEAAELLARLLPLTTEAGAGSALAEQILRRSSGVPFFLVSYAHGIRADNLEDVARGVPSDLGQNIRQRLAAPPPEAVELLGIAAVIGRHIPSALLISLSRAPEEEVLHALDALCRTRLLVADGDEAYLFAHDVIREIVEADLGALRRRVLHRRVAEVLERDGDSMSVGRLAYHYARSTESEKALLYLERAGDQALSLHANAEAEDYFRDLAGRLERMGRKEEAARAFEKLGGVLRLLAKHDSALLAFEQSVTIYRLLGDAEGIGRATAQIGWVHARRGTPQEGRVYVESFLASRHGDYELTPLTLATLEVVLAELCLVNGRYTEQLRAAERAAQLAQTIAEPSLMTQAELRQGAAYFNLGKAEKARGHLLHTIEVAQQTGGLWSLCRAFNILAMVHQFAGAFDQAMDTSRRALEAAELLGDPTAIAFLQVISGDTAFYLGTWDEAYTHFERATQLMRQVGPSWISPFPLLALGTLALARGQYKEAEPLLEEAITSAEGMGELQALRYAHKALAERDLLEVRAPAALARLVPLLDRSGQEETHVTMLLPFLAWAYLELGDIKEAERWGTESIRRATEAAYQVPLVDALRIHGLILAEQNRHKEAEQLLERSLALSRALPWPYAEVKTLFVYGRLLRQKGKDQEATLRYQAALALCALLGERLYADKIEAALEAAQ